MDYKGITEAKDKNVTEVKDRAESFMLDKNTNIGIDPGTSSCGYASTNADGSLKVVNGEPLIGTKLYPKGETCEERRVARGGRNNRKHKNKRLQEISNLFRKPVEEKDPHFFDKMKDSWKHPDHRIPETPPHSFHLCDADKKRIPTMSHLIHGLIYNYKDYSDIRYTYTAVYNISSRRGNYLHNGLDEDCTGMCDINEVFESISSVLEDDCNESFPKATDPDKVMDILKNTELAKKEKKKELILCLNLDKSLKKACTFLDLICGSKIKVKALVEDDCSDESICFDDSDYNDKADMYARLLGSEMYKAVEQAKALYDAAILETILQGEEYLCDARVKNYDKHKEDLKLLKKVCKKYGKNVDSEAKDKSGKKIWSDYDKMFHMSKDGECEGIYPTYVNHDTTRKSTVKRGMGGSKKRSKQTFYDAVKNTLTKWDDGNDPDITKILNDIEAGTFMPKQITSQNCVIPIQVQLKMVRKILSNAEMYHPFLLEKNEYGLTVSERIIEWFKFRIEYWMGPLYEESEANGGNGWIIRSKDGEITPWNLSEKIDAEATRKKFIERMVKNCSYLPDKKAMPKESMVYQEFTIHNALNNIKTNNEPLSRSLKADIINDLYKTGRKVSKKKLFNYLNQKGLADSEKEISGIKDDGIGFTMSSYTRMHKILGDRLDEPEVYKVAEDIIYYSTIFGLDKSLLEKYIRNNYGRGTVMDFDDDTVEALSKQRFSEWGALSCDFINLEGVRLGTGEKITLIDALRESTYNLMQLINSNDTYDFITTLEARTQKKSGKDIFDVTLDDMSLRYVSNPVKRMTWQAILTVRELIMKTGCIPGKLFIESTRNDGEKEEVQSRGETLKKKYEAIIKGKDNPFEDKKLAAQMLKLLESDIEKDALKNDRLFLWYSQMGFDAYSAKPIAYEVAKKSGSTIVYDRDHIIPQKYRKETSVIDGLVLTKHLFNCDEKKDVYPVDVSIRNNPVIRALWSKLLRYDFMTTEKYNRLIRSTPLTDMEKAEFINAQLVATGQAVMLLKNLFTDLLPGTEVILVKARLVSDFRQEFDIPKSRILNCDHHAHDAYLAIIAGNAHHVKFTKSAYNYIKDADKNKTETYNISKMYKRDIIRNNEVAWKAGPNGTIATVYKSIYEVKPTIRNVAYEGHGKFTDTNPISHRLIKEKTRYLPLKQSGPMSDIYRYGCYRSIKGAYFFIVEYDEKKGSRKTSYEQVPLYLKSRIESDPNGLEKYCEKVLGLKNAVIKNRKVLFGTKLNVDGYHIYITGKTGSNICGTNAEPLRLSREDIRYVQKIEKYVKTGKLDVLISAKKNVEFYDMLVKTLKESVFAKRVGAKSPSFCDTITNGRDKFIALPVIDEKDNRNKVVKRGQLYVLYQILSATSIGGNAADLEAIGGVKSSGIIRCPGASLPVREPSGRVQV